MNPIVGLTTTECPDLPPPGRSSCFRHDGSAEEEAELTKVQKEDHWLTIAFPTPSRDLDVRCGPTVIINKSEDIDIYAVDLDFIFFGFSLT